MKEVRFEMEGESWSRRRRSGGLIAKRVLLLFSLKKHYKNRCLLAELANANYNQFSHLGGCQKSTWTAKLQLFACFCLINSRKGVAACKMVGKCYVRHSFSLSLPVFCWWIGEWRRRSKVERQNRVVAVSLVAERMDRAEANRQRTLFVFAYPANPPPPLATPYTKLYKSQATRWRKHWARFPPPRSRRACQSSWRPSWSSESDLK